MEIYLQGLTMGLGLCRAHRSAESVCHQHRLDTAQEPRLRDRADRHFF